MVFVNINIVFLMILKNYTKKWVILFMKRFYKQINMVGIQIEKE